MALALGVKIGDVVDIATHWIAVLSVDSRRTATLIRDDGRKVTISQTRMTELASEVWVGLGPELTTGRLRLVIDAPRRIAITRRHN